MTPEHIAEQFCLLPMSRNVEDHKRLLQDAIATALREARNQALEEVKAIAAQYADSNPPRFIETPNRAEFNRGWESAGWSIQRDIDLLKHKDGQP